MNDAAQSAPAPDSATALPNAPPVPVAPVPAVAPQKRRWPWFLGLLLAAGGGAGGTVYYLGQQWLTQNQQQQAQVAALATQMQTLDSRWQSWRKELSQENPAQAQMQQNLQALSARQQTLEETTQALLQKLRKAGDEEDWSIAEVSYLLRVAQQRLSLGQDVAAALTALQAADTRLQRAGPLFLPVREQLTKDISQLSQIQAPDIDGMALQLAESTRQVDKLPLIQGTQDSARTAQPDAPAAKPPVENWQDALDAVWGELRQLVAIRYNDSADVGLLSPTQRDYLTEHMRLALETARLLLLRREQAGFRQELQVLHDWLRQYYDQGDEQVKRLYAMLAQMRTVELQPPLPDVSRSLSILQSLAAQSGTAASSETPATPLQVTP